MVRSLFVFGTRPEAIKLCPVVLHMKARPAEFDVRVAVTAQHRQMLDQVLAAFAVTPDYDLNLMTPGQTLTGAASRILGALEPVIADAKPDIIYVQGDTTTTLCGALAAFYAQVPVGHIEAGLRTGDLMEPFPEEMNRVVTGRLAAIHFAATEGARRNLIAEGVAPGRIHVTGNSGIDAVLHVRDRLASGELKGGETPGDPSFSDKTKRLIVVTAHRRESFGSGFENICRALATIARREDVEIVYPVHRNPNVTGPVEKFLSGIRNVHLIDPLDYVPFVDLMRRAYLVLTERNVRKPWKRERCVWWEPARNGSLRRLAVCSTIRRRARRCRGYTILMATGARASALALARWPGSGSSTQASNRFVTSAAGRAFADVHGQVKLFCPGRKRREMRGLLVRFRSCNKDLEKSAADFPRIIRQI
jgi:UDP-N-acetylglucosamine 2-epimerase (non-hydrolysing)